MKVRKNLEAIFLVAAAVATFASYATAEVPAARALPAVQASAPATGAAMQVVVVTAPRLSAAEKAALD